MKKNILLSFFIALAMICVAQSPCWDGTIAESYNGGDGTINNPYQIATAEQLALLAEQTNNSTGGDAFYILTNNINLENCFGGYHTWASIGKTIVTETDTIFRYFTGHFNGNGMTISNLYQHQDDYFKGLFGCTNGADIKNVNLSSFDIDNESEYAGALVAYAGRTNISNCNVVNSSIKTNTGIVGGIVGLAGMPFGINGQIEEYSEITSCSLSNVMVDGYWITGGIVGRINAYGGIWQDPSVFNHDYSLYSLNDCRNDVDCHVQGNRYTGGIVGLIGLGTIENCVNNCEVSGDINVGGICGCGYRYSSIINCLNNATGNIAAGACGGGITAVSSIEIVSCTNKAAGSGLKFGGIVGIGGYIIKDCVNEGSFGNESDCCGGIVGQFDGREMSGCVNYGNISGNNMVGGLSGETLYGNICGCANLGNVSGNGMIAGGLVGLSRVCVSNSYNRGDISAAYVESANNSFGVGGVAGIATVSSHIYNVYNTGSVYNSADPQNIYSNYGNIIGYGNDVENAYLNCYWLDDNDLPANGNPSLPDLPGSSSFYQGAKPTNWLLNDSQYDTDDLIEALNAGSEFVTNSGVYYQLTLISVWSEDSEGVNDGYPVVATYQKYPLLGSEWYYEIINSSGNASYQYLRSEDTVINHKKSKIIVKTNTLYDKSTQLSREYIYEYNGCVYWWHDLQQDSTMLYNFTAKVGDEWTIKVGADSIIMYVDEVGIVEYNGQAFKSLTVSDENDIFSGTIVCSVGHLTSFFPEKLLENKNSFEVDGIRCYWEKGTIIYQEGGLDCDAIYDQWHIGVDEIPAESEFEIYPNPANGTLFVRTTTACQGSAEYQIINLIGEIVLSGNIIAETQQINISNLRNGIYFIKIGENSVKLIVNKY